jgi:predicted DNA-binding protein (MmcQ/YjbR family)
VTWDELLAYCLAKPGAWQDEPWGEGDVVAIVSKLPKKDRPQAAQA